MVEFASSPKLRYGVAPGPYPDAGQRRKPERGRGRSNLPVPKCPPSPRQHQQRARADSCADSVVPGDSAGFRDGCGIQVDPRCLSVASFTLLLPARWSRDTRCPFLGHPPAQRLVIMLANRVIRLVFARFFSGSLRSAMEYRGVHALHAKPRRWRADLLFGHTAMSRELVDEGGAQDCPDTPR